MQKLCKRTKKELHIAILVILNPDQSDKAISYVMSFIEADSGENGKPKPEES